MHRYNKMVNDMKDISQPKRREFLRRLGGTLGVTAAVGLTSGFKLNAAMAFESLPDSASRPGVTFTQIQMAQLAKIARTVLPKTDTPSGEDLDCHGFVDYQLATCYSEQNQRELAEVIDVINAKAKKQHGKNFAELVDKQRLDLLNDVEALKGFNKGDKARFIFLKELIVFGYFTTEIGATQALNYLAVPGGFKGSIPYKEGDKAWGSFEYY